jgi:phosphoglycolate phosphatase-like HAD superfamily hydrolase
MRSKAVLFDMDDTLVKSWETKWAHHKFIAKKYYDIELTDEKLGKHWGEPFSKLVASLYGTPESIEKMMERFVQHEPEYLKRAHQETAEALAELQKEEVILGVVTAMISEVADEMKICAANSQ